MSELDRLDRQDWAIALECVDSISQERGVSLSGRLDRSPKKNWVENAGGLPKYIEDIALALERDGMPLSRAIPTAISRVKKWAAGGDDVKADTRAKAAKALAAWEALKSKNKAKSGAKAALSDADRAVAVLSDALVELSARPKGSLRRVRTLEGEKRYGIPIGSVIIADPETGALLDVVKKGRGIMGNAGATYYQDEPAVAKYNLTMPPEQGFDEREGDDRDESVDFRRYMKSLGVDDAGISVEDIFRRATNRMDFYQDLHRDNYRPLDYIFQSVGREIIGKQESVKDQMAAGAKKIMGKDFENSHGFYKNAASKIADDFFENFFDADARSKKG